MTDEHSLTTEKLQNFFINISIKNAILIIFTVGIIIFSNGLFNGFVGDDNGQILENPAVQNISNVDNFFSGSTFFIGKNTLVGIYYKPLMMTEYTLLYSVFGPHAFWYHLFQITLFITNSILLFLFFLNFFKKPTAFTLSLIFLVHPINSESAFYIAATQEVLYFFFGISGLLIISKFKSLRYLILASFLLFLSLLSKETGILFSVAAIFYILFYQRERLIHFIGLGFLYLSTYFLLKINAVGLFSHPSSTQISLLSLPDRLINIPSIIFFYLKTFFIPVDLANAYRWAYTEIELNNFVTPLMFDIFILVALVAFSFLLFNNKLLSEFKKFIFFIILLASGLLIHLQVLPLDLTVSERWFYFPIIGALGIIGVLLEYFKIDFKNKYFLFAFLILIILFSTRTFARSFDWRNQLILSYKDIQVSGEDYSAEDYIGIELLKQGKIDEAKIHTDRSVELFPYFTNYNTLGLIYMNKKDYKNAEEAFMNGMEYGDYDNLYENLGAVSILQEVPSRNWGILRKSVDKFPTNPKIWTFLAILEYKHGDKENAKKAITHAVNLSRSPNIIYVYNQINNNKPLDIKINTLPK